jgi:hypothetical protein
VHVVASPYWQAVPMNPAWQTQAAVGLHVPFPLQVVAAEQYMQAG